MIKRFISYRYFKPLIVSSNELVIFAWISKTAFGEEDNFILETLQRQINTEPDAIISRLIFYTWMNTFGDLNLDEKSLIIAILLPKVQKKSKCFQSLY